MTEVGPSAAAVDAARRSAGPDASIVSVTPLPGGTHTRTWLIRCSGPVVDMVLREYPVGDPAAAAEMHVLEVLDGLEGLAPRLVAGDLDRRWAPWPSVLISRLAGHADCTPVDPVRWARQLGEVLARLQRTPIARLAGLPAILERPRATPSEVSGPAAEVIRAAWHRMVDEPHGLVHSDFWSGNVVWDGDGSLTGIVDWSGAAIGPAGIDVGWCRLDLYLLYGSGIADEFLDAWVAALGGTRPPEIELWDLWAVAYSHREVESWMPNYRDLGRRDLTAAELRRRHTRRAHELLDGR